MTKIIAVANQKGGVGKTTCAVNLSMGLSFNHRVLLIDFDPQCHSGACLGFSTRGNQLGSYQFLLGKCRLSDILLTKDGLDLAAGNADITDAETYLASLKNRHQLLSEALAEVSHGYDYILIDCPPNLGTITINSFIASTNILVVSDSEYLAMDGISYLEDTLEVVGERLGKELNISLVLINKYQDHIRTKKDVCSEIKDYFNQRLLETKIRLTTKIADAPRYGQDVFSFDAKSRAVTDFWDLTKEIERRLH